MEKEKFLQKIKRIWRELGNSDIDVNREDGLNKSELAELANIKNVETEIRNGGSKARGFVTKANVDERKAGKTAGQKNTRRTSQKTL